MKDSQIREFIDRWRVSLEACSLDSTVIDSLEQLVNQADGKCGEVCPVAVETHYCTLPVGHDGEHRNEVLDPLGQVERDPIKPPGSRETFNKWYADGARAVLPDKVDDLVRYVIQWIEETR